jgi:hypothetical protein
MAGIGLDLFEDLSAGQQFLRPLGDPGPAEARVADQKDLLGGDPGRQVIREL